MNWQLELFLVVLFRGQRHLNNIGLWRPQEYTSQAVFVPGYTRTRLPVMVPFGQVGWHRVGIVYCKQDIVL